MMMIESEVPGACAVFSYAVDLSGYDFALDAQTDTDFSGERARFEAEQSLAVYDNQTRIANRQIAHEPLTKSYPFIFRDFGLSFEDWVLRLQSMP